jgi:flagellar motor switch protein FliM
MADLLSPEERAALQEPLAAAPGEARLVSPAVFPGVGQLDPEQTATLAQALRRWLEPVAQDLSRHLRLPCSAQLPHPEGPLLDNSAPTSMAEERFWAIIEGYPDSYLVISLPRLFAAAICERVFGAPFELREERDLALAEQTLLRDLVRRWLPLAVDAWPERSIHTSSAPDAEEGAPEIDLSRWIRFTSRLESGPVEGVISVTLAPFTTRVLLGEATSLPLDPCAPYRVAARVGDVPVELRAVLGEADFTLDELSSLRIGDVIALDRRANDPVDIVCESQALFRARAGLAGQWVAIELIGGPDEEKR